MAAKADRTALKGLEKKLFKLVSEKATAAQWSEWLRAPLEHAVAEGDKDVALTLLKAGANGGSGWEGCNDRTLLQAAAEGGNEEVVSTLLGKGGLEELDVASGDQDRTALHRALIGDHAGAARALMVAGADTSLLDAEKRSALHYAILGGHLQLAGDAIIGGANLKAKDANGDTPLHFAAAHDDDKFVSTILRRGARVDRPNREGQYPLHVAVEYGQLTVAEALLTAGADPNVRFGTSKRYSPLYFAVRRSPGMTRALLQHGANFSSSDDLGFTALHWAADYNASAEIDVLVEAGADLEASSSNLAMNNGVCGEQSFVGLTPLHVAAYYHRSLSMAALLRHGANVDAESGNGLTPLHMVCKTSPAPGSVKATDLLLRWDADETTTDHDGRTPKALVGGEEVAGLEPGPVSALGAGVVVRAEVAGVAIYWRAWWGWRMMNFSERS
ncbi:unnamed protein product [Ectocarpus sp. 12 AP-2014]